VAVRNGLQHPTRRACPRGLALAASTDRDAANATGGVYRPAFNQEFSHPAREEGPPSCPILVAHWRPLCEQHERTVGKDKCVRFRGMVLQIGRSHPVSLCQGQGPRASLCGRERLALFHGQGAGHLFRQWPPGGDGESLKTPRKFASLGGERRPEPWFREFFALPKRTFHVLQNRTNQFVANTNFSSPSWASQNAGSWPCR